MEEISSFAKALAPMGLRQVDLAVAIMWYLDRHGVDSEFSAADIAEILQDQGFAKPNVSRLRTQISAHKQTVRGKAANTHKISISAVSALNSEYEKLLKVKRRQEPEYSIIPQDTFKNTRGYLEKLADQINGTYELGFYDCCAVMMRRIIESLIIEVYTSQKREHEIKVNNEFCALETLINTICSDKNVHLTRGTKKIMTSIKKVGDTAAHSKTYITYESDISANIHDFRKMIIDLLSVSKIAN